MWLSVCDKEHDEHDERDAERRVDDMAAGSMIGLPDMRPSSFRKAMTEPVKVMAPMATPRLISTSAWPWMSPTAADAEAFRRVDGRGRHHDGGKADQAVEGGDELRHRRHGDAARDHRAGAAADSQAEGDQQQAA